MKKFFFIAFSISCLFSACIGDDIIEDTIPERLNISNSIDSLQVNTTHQYEANFFNNIGQLTERTIDWTSSDETLLSIDNQGLATAIDTGGVTITASITLDDNSTLVDETTVWISEEPVVIVEEMPGERSGSINTTSSYVLTGNFVLKEVNDQLVLELSENYQASASLPGLYVYLTNNPNTTSGAFEIGAVQTFSGAHSYTISGVDLDEYNYLLYFCKPFSVKVGDGQIE